MRKKWILLGDNGVCSSITSISFSFDRLSPCGMHSTRPGQQNMASACNSQSIPSLLYSQPFNCFLGQITYYTTFQKAYYHQNHKNNQWILEPINYIMEQIVAEECMWEPHNHGVISKIAKDHLPSTVSVALAPTHIKKEHKGENPLWAE